MTRRDLFRMLLAVPASALFFKANPEAIAIGVDMAAGSDQTAELVAIRPIMRMSDQLLRDGAVDFAAFLNEKGWS